MKHGFRPRRTPVMGGIHKGKQVYLTAGQYERCRYLAKFLLTHPRIKAAIAMKWRGWISF
jgi:hypothetical protein